MYLNNVILVLNLIILLPREWGPTLYFYVDDNTPKVIDNILRVDKQINDIFFKLECKLLTIYMIAFCKGHEIKLHNIFGMNI